VTLQKADLTARKVGFTTLLKLNGNGYKENIELASELDGKQSGRERQNLWNDTS